MAKSDKKDKQLIHINDKTIFVRNEEDFLVSEIDGESVLMNNTSGHYWGLNQTTTDIWNAIKEEASFNDIIEALLAKYDVDRTICQKETLNVISGLIKTNIIKVREQ